VFGSVGFQISLLILLPFGEIIHLPLTFDNLSFQFLLECLVASTCLALDMWKVAVVTDVMCAYTVLCMCTDTELGSCAASKLPFAIDIPGSCGYHTQMVDGVMRVYASQSSVDNDTPLDYQFPDLMQFLVDQNLLFCLIADGPL